MRSQGLTVGTVDQPNKPWGPCSAVTRLQRQSGVTGCAARLSYGDSPPAFLAVFLSWTRMKSWIWEALIASLRPWGPWTHHAVSLACLRHRRDDRVTVMTVSGTQHQRRWQTDCVCLLKCHLFQTWGFKKLYQIAIFALMKLKRVSNQSTGVFLEGVIITTYPTVLGSSAALP